MICQNCGHEFPKGNICPTCKSDALLLNKARMASLKQYNKGVTAAKEGDYSSAIDSLNQCILFDKRNHVARNLLGIAYFEVGMVSDALKEWIISVSIQPEKNPAAKYIDALQKNARTLEKYDDAIAMYNNAIDQFRLGSEDLAVIQLKKAIDFNNKFVEAYNLLTLYYINKNDKTNAAHQIDKVLEIDKRNPKALQYLSHIASSGNNKDKNATFKTGYNDKVDATDRLKKIFRVELATFVLGVVITLIISLVIIMPGYNDSLKRQILDLEDKVSVLEEENENGTSTFSLKYKNLEEEYYKALEENQAYKIEDENRQQLNDLQLANIFVAGGQYFEAAELLYGLNSENFDEDDIQLIESLKTQSYTYAAKVYYDNGNSFFIAGNGEEARVALEKALEFGKKEDFIDNTLYILGQIYEIMGDYGQAKEYYGRVLNEFSDSDVFNAAEEKLNNLLISG